MKNLSSIPIYFVIFVSLTLGNNPAFAIFIPKNYNPYVINGGVKTYKHNTKEVYAIVVKIAETDISFGGNVGYYDKDTYYKGSIGKHWLENSTYDTAVILNGQFFDVLLDSSLDKIKYFTRDPARLVYPILVRNLDFCV